MKTENVLKILIWTVITVAATSFSSIAQCPLLNPATTVDNCAGGGVVTPCNTPGACGGSAINCFHTGNDVEKTDPPALHVMTWEQQSKTIRYAWDDGIGNKGIVNLNGSTKAKDPDVIIWHDKRIMVIVYIDESNSDEIRADAYSYSGILFTPITLFQNMRLSASGIACTSPNIDIAEEGTFSGKAVVTWEQAGDIYANVIDLVPFLPSIVYTNGIIIYNTSFLAKDPDVAVNETGGSSGALAHFVYSYDDGSVFQVEVARCKMSGLTTGFGCSTPSVHQPIQINRTHIIGPPRIGCPPGPDMTNFAPTDYAVTVEDRDWATWNFKVLATANYFGVQTPGGSVTVNSFGGLTSCLSIQPVITYSGDYIIVAWTHADGCNIVGSGDYDVLARRLFFTGILADNCYSIVPYCIGPGMQTIDSRIPSLAGNGSPTAFTYFAFYHNDGGGIVQNVVYKKSHYANINLKRYVNNNEPYKEQKIEYLQSYLEIYPNPFLGQLDIVLNVADGDAVRELLVYDLSGNIIHKQELSMLEGGEHFIIWDSYDLPTGNYFLKLITINSISVYRACKID
ncbi:MAG: T9SS type A sorting domain-containing protein [Bacteroidetes bacterium]|nr:T9SS type A sorting domain-containing protein [Bacteroidota bacterium]